jgi:hypothetical protein
VGPDPLVLLVAAVPPGLVLLYAVLATALPTSWTIDSAGLTLRSAAVLGIPIRIAWTDIVSIGFDTRLVHHTTLKSMNLDGRIMVQRHVTLVRSNNRAVQFTPRGIEEFESQLLSFLGRQPDWSRRDASWYHGALPSGTGR